MTTHSESPLPHTSAATRRTRIVVDRADSLLLRPDGHINDKEPNRDNPRLAIYTRRSEKKETSSSLSRQEAQLFTWATELGGTFDRDIDCYFDDDISAKGGKWRPGLESLLKAIEEGHYDGVLVWEFTRWTRNRRDNRVMTDHMRTYGCELYSYNEKWLSLFGEVGFLVEWAADLAARESERTSARITDWHAFKSQVGAVHARAPFGMRKFSAQSPWPDRAAAVKYLEPDDTPLPQYGGKSPADLMANAFAQVDAGSTPYAITQQWAAQGWPSPTGITWHPTALTRLLKNREFAGQATIAGKEVIGDDGNVVSPHTPLVDLDQFKRVQARLETTGSYGARTDSPLRGLFKCATCNKSLGWGKCQGKAGAYRCIQSTSPNCTKRTAVNGEKAVAWVLEAVAVVLDDPARLDALLRREDHTPQIQAQARAELETHNEALEQLEADHYNGDFTDPQGDLRYRKHRERLLQQIADAHRVLDSYQRQLPPSYHALRTSGNDVREALTQMTAPERLHLVRQLIDRVVVAPAAARVWNPDRMTIVWRTM